jgi:hypothetical protein
LAVDEVDADDLVINAINNDGVSGTPAREAFLCGGTGCERMIVSLEIASSLGANYANQIGHFSVPWSRSRRM